MSKTFILMGNGFSIGFIDNINDDEIKKSVDLRNLFSCGDKVRWPNVLESGFLSHKYCPNLWTLGARPTLCREEAQELITEIITCMNVYNLVKRREDGIDLDEDSNIYIQAYNELCTYLKNLFIYYNSLIDDNCINDSSKENDLVEYIEKERALGNQVIIVDYNYDIFLERIMINRGIPFYIAGIIGEEEDENKVQIIKPHGSISFCIPVDLHNYNIKKIFDSIAEEITKIKLDYNPDDSKSALCAIIPPAGDSARVENGWSKFFRTEIDKLVRDTTERDKLVIYGLSYDHVDRMEIDSVITNMNPAINVKYINPFPSKTLDAVLSSVFNNYIQSRKLY